MAQRSDLLELLIHHLASDEKEARDLKLMLEHARSLEDPFSPAQLPAHFTASAVVIDPQALEVCLIHHKKLGRWLQPGGHVEPADQGRLLVAALREVREETGLEVKPHPLAPSVVDVDVHRIPARGTLAEHDHLDVRFVTLAESKAARFDPAESSDLRWFGWQAALGEAGDAALVRLLCKARALAQGGVPQTSVP